MIEQIISQYISDHKRIVIPELGTILRKDSGELVFVELLRKDDGVLASLISTQASISEPQARTNIATFVANVKNTITESGKYSFDGIGTFIKENNGSLSLISGDQQQRSSDIKTTIQNPTENSTISESDAASRKNNNSTFPPTPRTKQHFRSNQKSSNKMDIVLIVAIVAALLAIGAIVYGALVDENLMDKLRPTSHTIENITETSNIVEE